MTAGNHRVGTASFSNVVDTTRLQALTMTVLQRRITTFDRLTAQIGACGDANTGPIQDGMIAFRAGAWSPPEETLIRAVAADPRLPAMHANIRLEDAEGRFIGTPDGYFTDAGVVVQVHSREFHTGEDENGQDRWGVTVRRDTEYQTHGLVVVQVIPEALDADLPGFLDRLALVLAAHRGRGPRGVRVRARNSTPGAAARLPA